MDEKDSASDERAETNSSVTPEPVFKPFSSHSFGASSRFISTRASATLQPKASSQVTFSADVLDGDRPASHDRKRNRRALQDDSAIDEIMGQITMKLTSLSTGDPARSQHESICAFLEVLGCTESEASFYLDSSAWDIQTAVILWLENNPHPTTSFAVRPQFGEMIRDVPFDNPFAAKFWKNREVHIPDLPSDWKAFVSSADGTIYFTQLSTGRSQKQVPPGFADPNSNTDSETVMAVVLNLNGDRLDEDDDNNDALLQHALLNSSETINQRFEEDEGPQNSTNYSNSNSYYTHFPALDPVTAQTLAYAELPSPQSLQRQRQPQQSTFSENQISNDGVSALEDEKMDQEQFSDI